jgi:PAS domain S-box-containing protein
MVDPAVLRLAAVVASSEDAIVTETLDGNIETWNRSAERLFGYSEADIVGCPIEVIVPPEIRDAGENTSLCVQRGQPARHFETVGLTKDGRRVPISVSLSTVVAPHASFAISPTRKRSSGKRCGSQRLWTRRRMPSPARI